MHVHCIMQKTPSQPSDSNVTPIKYVSRLTDGKTVGMVSTNILMTPDGSSPSSGFPCKSSPSTEKKTWRTSSWWTRMGVMVL